MITEALFSLCGFRMRGDTCYEIPGYIVMARGCDNRDGTWEIRDIWPRWVVKTRGPFKSREEMRKEIMRLATRNWRRW